VRKLSFSNIYNKEMWDQHTSRWRYVRHLREWPTSRLLRRILPQFTVLMAWAFTSSLFRRKNMSVPLTPLSLLSTFVAALLTLRSNQGLNRLSQGRLAFGSVVLHTRDFAHLLSAYVMPLDPVLGLMMGT
jgi:predicted membrane chloride channel (bestrophin family)